MGFFAAEGSAAAVVLGLLDAREIIFQEEMFLRSRQRFASSCSLARLSCVVRALRMMTPPRCEVHAPFCRRLAYNAREQATPNVLSTLERGLAGGGEGGGGDEGRGRGRYLYG